MRGLRNKVDRNGCYGYLLRSLGTCLSNPFENENRYDPIARLRALHSQFSTLHRRGTDRRFSPVVWGIILHYWGSYKKKQRQSSDDFTDMTPYHGLG